MQHAPLPHPAMLAMTLLGGGAMLYVAIAALSKKEIYVRGGLTFRRREKPVHYWSAVVVASLLAVFMFGMHGYLWWHDY